MTLATIRFMERSPAGSRRPRRLARLRGPCDRAGHGALRSVEGIGYIPKADLESGPFRVHSGSLYIASIKGKRIVFTGELESMTRPEAQVRAKSLGAIVGSSVTAETDLLVAGPGAGSKLKATLKHGVNVINEVAWIKMAGGGGKAATKKAGKKSAKKAGTRRR